MRHARDGWRGLRAQEAVAISVAAFLFTIVLAKGLDRSYSILTEDSALAVPMWGKAVVNAVEECLELTLTRSRCWRCGRTAGARRKPDSRPARLRKGRPAAWRPAACRSAH